MGLFSRDDIKEVGNYYIIDEFPVGSFTRAVSRKYTGKLMHIFQAMGTNFFNSNKRRIRIHKFFVPELIYLMKQFKWPKDLINYVIDGTWVGEATKDEYNNRADIGLIKEKMNITLKDYQEDFVRMYDIRKQESALNGYLLSFDQGLGKTLTSLALMVALKKKTVVIIAPKSTLESVWDYHCKTFFKEKQKVVMIGRDELTADAKFERLTKGAGYLEMLKTI